MCVCVCVCVLRVTCACVLYKCPHGGSSFVVSCSCVCGVCVCVSPLPGLHPTPGRRCPLSPGSTPPLAAMAPSPRAPPHPRPPRPPLPGLHPTPAAAALPNEPRSLISGPFSDQHASHCGSAGPGVSGVSPGVATRVQVNGRLVTSGDQRPLT